EGVTKIGNAFGGCESLTSVVVPDTVKEIEIRTFSGCTAMKEWGISPTNPYFKTDGPALLTKDGKKLLSCLYWAKEYRIPDGVTKIEAYAFVGRDSLTSVVIPESVREIGQSAFLGCRALKSVVIPEGVRVIEHYAFMDCRSLTSVEISGSVTEIWYGAFLDCPNLTIHAPKGSYAEKYAKEHGIPFEAK
ncbi:MAG: leucine-rich repeat domain-containing protein, partial [Thermoguttaceae bacterium]|nr:leucine-rich repeat domain-containing protein [Thermoguttaceae bacterium]